MPTPSTRLPRVMTFREKSIRCMRIRADRMEMGMDVPTIRDALISPKNSRMITMEMITAMIIVWYTDDRED